MSPPDLAVLAAQSVAGEPDNKESPKVVTPASSGTQSPANENANTSTAAKMKINSSLQDLQTEEQGRVLDTVSQIRKCGLESVLSLPQIVVCGDQSAGKSSVLEALTEIPFPRSDNLCTRFATEISLRREQVDSLTIRVIPDSSRPELEQAKIKAYSETITDFSELPNIMENAKEIMGISISGSAFSKDVLSTEICGPERPQLTLVDIPGLIQATTKGVSAADVAMVGEITNRYIEQPRTICLAVISATNDAANQPILDRVRKVDPEGERTLGVITKLDKLDEGSGTEEKFLELARNEDVFFKLGWHAIKNRKYEERDFSFEKRNRAEEEFFQTSTFSCLAKENVGIDALRVRLSQLLFDHIKKELPRLHDDLESALKTNRGLLKDIGDSRSSTLECRMFLARLNAECYEISKAALEGTYEHIYFKAEDDALQTASNPESSKRLRAAVQFMNQTFAEVHRTAAHKYKISETGPEQSNAPSNRRCPIVVDIMGWKISVNLQAPQLLSRANALKWVRNRLVLSRGTELAGNFNPRLIAELFWEQSERWEEMAKAHIQNVHKKCEIFLVALVCSRGPLDVHQRIQRTILAKELESRKTAALDELQNLVQDLRECPINYNHYYTDTIQKKRQERLTAQLRANAPTSYLTDQIVDTAKVVEQAVSKLSKSVQPNMEEFACADAIDCMLAIYKAKQKVFIDNVTTQVIERRLIRGLEEIFCSKEAVSMADDKVEALVSEPAATKRERVFRADRVKKLEEGQEIFQGVMGIWN